MAARTERPATVAALAEVLTSRGGTVRVAGAGTKAEWGGRPEPTDLVIETGAMARLLTHDAADMTASVEAGMPLATLQEHLARSGQRLAIDPPSEAAGATVGGLLATGDAGPARLRYGAMRDLVIGVTLVLADGTVARSGGHVIKNVAGYDLAKLASGSLGAFAVIAEVVVRLHPLPEHRVTLAAAATAEQAAAAARALMASPLEPTALEWVGTVGDGRLFVRFESSPAGVAAQSEGCRAALGDLGLNAGELDADSAKEAWRDLDAGVIGADGETVARAGTLPSRLTEVARLLETSCAANAVTGSLTSSAALGLSTARITGGTPAAQAGAFGAWRDAVAALGGTVQLRRRPDGVDAVVDAMGPPPSTVALLGEVKRAFDPDRRLGSGRFGSWF